MTKGEKTKGEEIYKWSDEGLLLPREYKTPVVMSFYSEDKEVGKLTWENGKIEFIGECDKSAKALFDFLRIYIDDYIEDKIKVK